MPYHWFASDRKEGLGTWESELCAGNEEASSQSRDNGLILVPFDGPPTRITPLVTDILSRWVTVEV